MSLDTPKQSPQKYRLAGGAGSRDKLLSPASCLISLAAQGCFTMHPPSMVSGSIRDLILGKGWGNVLQSKTGGAQLV